jgi:hypothetical protein
MRTNEDGSIILIENPRTGSESVSKALGLSPHESLPRWATPNEARHHFPSWRDAKKIVLVRDPYARFLSGVQLACLYNEQSLIDMPPLFAAVLDEVSDRSPAVRADAILDYMKAGGAVPTFLQPQKQWLSCKVDVILATSDIAEYFNKEVGKCCLRSNESKAVAGWQGRRAAPSDALLREVYAEDFALIAKLSVWSPDPKRVRLVAGFCPTCDRQPEKKGELISPASLGAENEEAELAKIPEAEQEGDDLHVRAIPAPRKRSKQATGDE